MPEEILILDRLEESIKNREGKVIAISVSKKKGIAKTNVQTARLIENYGIEGDVTSRTIDNFSNRCILK